MERLNFTELCIVFGRILAEYGLKKLACGATLGRRLENLPFTLNLSPVRPQAALFQAPGGPNGWRCSYNNVLVSGPDMVLISALEVNHRDMLVTN